MKLGLGLGFAPVTIRGDGSGVVYSGIGTNLAGITSYTYMKVFANLMYHAGKWLQYSGSGSWTQDKGTLTPTVGTDIFRAYVSDHGEGLPAGTTSFRVYNPDGCQIAIGKFNDPVAYQTWTTSTQFDFNFTNNASDGIFLFAKGNVTNSTGNIAIIPSSLISSWGTKHLPGGSGDIFDPAFISYLQGIAPSVIRFMDWTNAGGNLEVDWADRTPPDAITFSNWHALGFASVPPYEVMFELCNRLNAEPWICLPVRASADYITQFGNLAASKLTNGKRVWAELGNEVWNFASAYYQGWQWVGHLTETKYTATVNSATSVLTYANHGLNSDDVVVLYATPENVRNLADFSTNWKMSGYETAYVVKIDANTFTLRTAAGGGGSQIFAGTGQVNCIYSKYTAAANSTNYGQLSARNWDLLEASALGVSRTRRMIGSMSVSTAVSSARVTATGDPTRVDYVATAPYVDSYQWHVSIDVASGQFTPKWWTSDSGHTLYVAVYPNASTPTIADIIAGTGAVAVRSVATKDNSTNAGNWENLSAITGLTNGTTYKVWCLTVMSDGTHWVMSQSIVASATPSTVIISDTYANQLIRDNISVLTRPSPGDHYVATGRPQIIYEYCVTSTNNMGEVPSSARSWYTGYLNSAECGTSLTKATNFYAADGAVQMEYFEAANGTDPFSANADYSDTTDPRLVALKTFGGRVRKRSLMSQSDILAGFVTSAPSYPYVVQTFPNAGWTYTIVGGDLTGNFDISGANLRMVNGTGINWSGQQNRSLKIHATDGYTFAVFTVSLGIGLVGPSYLISLMSVAPDATRQGHITTLYNSLYFAGIMGKLDGLYILDAHDAQAAQLNWATIGSFNLTPVNSPTFTVDRGYAGNGSNAYLTTGFDPTTAPSPKFGSNAHIGVWSRTNATNTGNDMGAPARTAINSRSSTGNTMRGLINEGGSNNYGAVADSVGHSVLVRNSSSLVTGYRNGSPIGTASGTGYSPISGAIDLLRGNGSYTTRQLAAAHFGGVLTDAETAALYSALNTYHMAVGAV